MDWVLIKNKFPKEGERVLVLLRDKPHSEDFHICCGRLFNNENVPSKFQLDDDSVDDMLRDDREITHWMPLPKKPI